MAIIATRIDGRLIHGQVANLWITTKLRAPLKTPQKTYKMR